MIQGSPLKEMRLSWKSTGPLVLGAPRVEGATVIARDDAAGAVRVNAPAKGEVRLDWDARAERPGMVELEVTALTDEASDAMRAPAFPVIAHGAPRFV